MIKNPKFDDIRPYDDDEIAEVIERLVKNAQFRGIVSMLFPERKWELIEQLMRSCVSRNDFQYKIIRGVAFELIYKTLSCITWKGLENIPKNSACVFISNHRDIVLDATLLCKALLDDGYDTVEIAIGDNLLLTDWIEDLERLNKSFIVKRKAARHQMLETAKHLSEYIHFTIKDKNQSIWIAQREGRAKDSNDRTQESLLKMLAMGSDRQFLESLSEINLTPLTLSYEYDPCDYLKAKEFQQKRDNPDFAKSRADDLLSMQTGVLGYKGAVHLQFGRPINPSLLKIDSSLKKNELASKVASIVDEEIFRNYKFFPINYIAYDRLGGKGFFRDRYTGEDIKKVENYFQQQLDKIDLPGKNIPYLTERLEEMYAYPVKNQLTVMNYEL